MVREKRKDQVVDTLGKTKERIRITRSIQNLFISPPSTSSIECPPTGPPSEAYQLGPPVLPLSRPASTSKINPSEECNPSGDGSQGERRSIRPYAASGYPLRKLAAGTVSVWGLIPQF